MPNLNNKKLRVVLLSIFIIFAVLLVVFNMRTRQEKKRPALTHSAVTIPTPIVLAEGSILIQQVSSESAVNSNAKQVQIVANSNQKSVVAYDVVIKYDRGAVEILSAVSLLPDFTVYPLGKSDHFVVTGAKKLDSTESIIFANTPILQLNIVPKKSGPITLNVVSTLGKEKSQLVDNKSNILSPEVGELKFQIN